MARFGTTACRHRTRGTDQGLLPRRVQLRDARSKTQASGEGDTAATHFKHLAHRRPINVTAVIARRRISGGASERQMTDVVQPTRESAVATQAGG